jgi:hypothetical protein
MSEPLSSNPVAQRLRSTAISGFHAGTFRADVANVLHDGAAEIERLTAQYNEAGVRWAKDLVSANAEIERLTRESDEWDKHSLVQIVRERDRLRAALVNIVAYSGCEDNDQYYEDVDAIARKALEAAPPAETTGDTGAIFHKPGCSAITGRLLTCDCGAHSA